MRENVIAIFSNFKVLFSLGTLGNINMKTIRRKSEISAPLHTTAIHTHVIHYP